MKFIDIELRFVRQSILESMERHGLTPEKVAMVATRVQERPYLGRAALKDGSSVFEFYWLESTWKEYYRVLYRRLETLETTQVTMITFQTVQSPPKDAPKWAEPAKFLGKQLTNSVFRAAFAAVLALF